MTISPIGITKIIEFYDYYMLASFCQMSKKQQKNCLSPQKSLVLQN